MASDIGSEAFKIERYFTPKVTVIHGYHSAMLCMVQFTAQIPKPLYLCLTKEALMVRQQIGFKRLIHPIMSHVCKPVKCICITDFCHPGSIYVQYILQYILNVSKGCVSMICALIIDEQCPWLSI